MLRRVVVPSVLAVACASAMSAEAAAPNATRQPVTVLYRDEAVQIERTLPDPSDLWVTAEDLPRANGFVLKPEGACLDELCVPIKQDRESDLFVQRDGDRWVCVSELADRLGQKYAVDADTRTWSLGEVPATRRAFLEQGMAPDFELPNLEGELVRLSDFRGKKVLLVTWASW
jgi:hypothetical protein